MADIEKINVNGTTYNVRPTFDYDSENQKMIIEGLEDTSQSIVTNLYLDKTYKFTLKPTITNGNFGMANMSNGAFIGDSENQQIITFAGTIGKNEEDALNGYAYVCDDTIDVLDNLYGESISNLQTVERNKWYFMDVDNGAAVPYNNTLDITMQIDSVNLQVNGEPVESVTDDTGEYYDISSILWMFDTIEEASGGNKTVDKFEVNGTTYQINLSNVYTKTEVDNAIETAINNITDGDEVSY